MPGPPVRHGPPPSAPPAPLPQRERSLSASDLKTTEDTDYAGKRTGIIAAVARLVEPLDKILVLMTVTARFQRTATWAALGAAGVLLAVAFVDVLLVMRIDALETNLTQVAASTDRGTKAAVDTNAIERTKSQIHILAVDAGDGNPQRAVLVISEDPAAAAGAHAALDAGAPVRSTVRFEIPFDVPSAAPRPDAGARTRK